MTQVLLETLNEIGTEPRLVDRRFSRQISDVGRFSITKVLASVGLLVRLARAVMRPRPAAVVFFMTTRTHSFLVDFVLLQLLRVARVPVIGYLHTRGYRELASRGWPFTTLVRSSLRIPRRFVCLSPTLANDVAPWVGADRITYIANTPADPPPPPTQSGKSTVLFLSNLLPEKGPAAFVRAATKISKDYPALRFVVAGPPASQAFMSELRHLSRPLGDRIRFFGRAGSEEKWDLLKNSALLVFPSAYASEAQPLTIVEALAAGTPVVAYGVGGIPDMIDADTGAVVPPGDEEGLVTAMRSILSDPELLSRMSLAASQRYRATFSRGAYETSWRAILSHRNIEVFRP